MPFLDVYIGDLNDPSFSWENGDWNGNCPKRQSPFFPPPAPFSEMKTMIEQGELVGKQVDWGGWVAKAKKDQIMKIVNDYYLGDWYERNSFLPHLIKQMKELQEYITSLDSEIEYALVASELKRRKRALITYVEIIENFRHIKD